MSAINGVGADSNSLSTTSQAFSAAVYQAGGGSEEGEKAQAGIGIKPPEKKTEPSQGTITIVTSKTITVIDWKWLKGILRGY